MARLTVRGLAARKLRAFLTALAVLLGVMMISGTYVFTDTINRSFDRIFAEGNKGTDVVVVPRTEFHTRNGSLPPPFSQKLLGRVKRMPGVAQAVGSVSDLASIFTKNGKQVKTRGAPPLLLSTVPERFDPLKYTLGGPPTKSDLVALDKGTADKKDLKVGDQIRLAGKAPSKLYTISGIAKYGDISSLGGATIAIVTLAEAQRISEKTGELGQISIAATRGTNPAMLVAAVKRAMPKSVEVKTGSQEASDQADSIKSGLSFLNTALLVFAAIALFVGGFIIFNTFSITVTQRTREFALLRTLGASARQVLGSVLVEALLIGFSASIIGLLAGVFAAKGIGVMFKAFGADLPQEGTVVETRTIVVGLVVGVLVSVVSGLAPARRATGVPPLAALREEVTVAARHAGRRRTVVALALLAAGPAVLAYGLFAAEGTTRTLSLLGLGAVGIFLGVALISTRLVKPLASGIGLPLERLCGVTGQLARENALRNPGRTAVTAAALMVGLALITFVTVLAASLRASIDDTLDKSFAGDLILQNTDGFSPIPVDAAKSVTKIPGVALVSPMRSSEARVKGSSGHSFITGIDPRTFTEVWKPEWKRGSNEVFKRLRPADAVLVNSYAESHGFGVGDKITLTSSIGKVLTLTVRGTIDNKGNVFGNVVTTNSVLERDFGAREDQIDLVAVAPGASVTAVQTDVERELQKDFPVVESKNQKQFKDQAAKRVNTILSLFYALLSLSVVVSLFGIVNTLVLSIHERTRELGMMRAIGTSRRQVRRVVRYESVITALIGAALGLAVGLFLAILTTVALSSQGFKLSIPVGSLIGFMILAALAGVLAAIPPARRAARLDVLEALAYE